MKKQNVSLLLSMVLLLIGAIVIWQGFRLLKHNPEELEVSDAQITTPQDLSPTSIHNQNPEIDDENLSPNVPGHEISTSEPMVMGASIKLILPTGITEITAENAVMVTEIARLGSGNFSVFESDGSILTEKSIPIDSIGEALLSPDNRLLLLRGEFGKAVLNLESFELDFLEEIDYRLYKFTPDSQGFLTRLSGSSKGEKLFYYDLKTDTIIPFTQSPNESNHLSFTDVGSFSQDSKLFAASYDQKSVQVWRVHNGELLLDLDMSKGSTQRVDELVFSPDSSQLSISTSGKESAETILIDPTTGELRFLLEGLHEIRFLPTDNLLITYGIPGVQLRKVWDLNTSTLLGEIETYNKAQDKEALLNHPLFELLSIENANTLREFLNFPKTLEEQVEIPLSLSKYEKDISIEGSKLSSVYLSGHTGEVGLATFIRDHSLILSHATDGTIRLWGVHENQLSRFLIGHETGVQQVAFSPDGSMLASVDYDGMMWLWDTKTRAPIGHWQIVLKPSGYDPKSVYFSGDGSKLFFAPPLGREIYIWDVDSQNIIFNLVSEDQLFFDALLYPNSDLLAIRKLNGTTRNLEWNIYRWTDKSIVNQFEDQLIWSLSTTSDLSPDGAYLAVLDVEYTGQVKINIVDLTNGEPVISIPLGKIYESVYWGGVLFSPDGSKLTNGISVWDTENWRENLQFSKTSNQIRLPVRFTDDGESLAIFQVLYNSDEHKKPEIGIYRMQDGKMVKKIEIDIFFYGEGYLPSIDITPDMNLIAAPYGDKIILTEVP